MPNWEELDRERSRIADEEFRLRVGDRYEDCAIVNVPESIVFTKRDYRDPLSPYPVYREEFLEVVQRPDGEMRWFAVDFRINVVIMAFLPEERDCALMCKLRWSGT